MSRLQFAYVSGIYIAVVNKTKGSTLHLLNNVYKYLTVNEIPCLDLLNTDENEVID